MQARSCFVHTGGEESSGATLSCQSQVAPPETSITANKRQVQDSTSPPPKLTIGAKIITQERKRHININKFSRWLPGRGGGSPDRVGGGLPTGGQGSKVYVLCAEPKEHKHFRPGTRLGGIGFPAGRIGDRGDRGIVYVPNVYVPFPAPNYTHNFYGGSSLIRETKGTVRVSLQEYLVTGSSKVTSCGFVWQKRVRLSDLLERGLTALQEPTLNSTLGFAYKLTYSWSFFCLQLSLASLLAVHWGAF